MGALGASIPAVSRLSCGSGSAEPCPQPRDETRTLANAHERTSADLLERDPILGVGSGRGPGRGGRWWRLRGRVMHRSAVVSAVLSCQDRRGRTAQRGRPSRVIPPREGVDRCKRRTPRESPGSSTAAGSPGPGGGRPAPPGGVLCKGNGGSLRVAFLVIWVAFLAVERRGSESGVGAVSGGVGAVSGGVGGRSGSVVGGERSRRRFWVSLATTRLH